MSRFEPHGVSYEEGWGCLAMVALIGCCIFAFVVVINGGPLLVLLLPILMILPTKLANQHRVQTRLDVDGGAVVETRSLGSSGQSQSQSVDLSQVKEVRLRKIRGEATRISDVAPTRKVWMDYYAVLDGSEPEYLYETKFEAHLHEAGEYFAVALDVPLRLPDGDIRLPSEICEPLRDRLAHRSLPEATPVPWYEGNHVTVEQDEAAGTTKFVIPNVGADRGIRAAIWLNVIGLGLLFLTLGLHNGLIAGAILVVLTLVWAWIRTNESAVVTVLPDGGLELVVQLPYGVKTERIEGDHLDDIRMRHDSIVEAKGWPKDIWIGAGLGAVELEWLQRALCLAIAGRPVDPAGAASAPSLFDGGELVADEVVS